MILNQGSQIDSDFDSSDQQPNQERQRTSVTFDFDVIEEENEDPNKEPHREPNVRRSSMMILKNSMTNQMRRLSEVNVELDQSMKELGVVIIVAVLFAFSFTVLIGGMFIVFYF